MFECRENMGDEITKEKENCLHFIDFSWSLLFNFISIFFPLNTLVPR